MIGVLAKLKGKIVRCMFLEANLLLLSDSYLAVLGGVEHILNKSLTLNYSLPPKGASVDKMLKLN